MATQVPDASGKRVRGGSSDELEVIAQRAQALTNASGTAIALSEGNAGEIICRARAGSSAPEVGTGLRVEGTFTGLCIQSGKELLCDDAESDARVDQAAIRALGIRSMVAIPVQEGTRIAGVLAAFAPVAHAFTIAHVAVLKSLAGQVATYLERKQRDEARSPEPRPAPPARPRAASAAASASPMPGPAAVIKAAPPAGKPRQLLVVPKVEPGRTGSFAAEIDPAPFSAKKDTNSRERGEYKSDFRRAFSTLDGAAEPGTRSRANVLMIGAATVVVIAVAAGLSLKLRKPAAAPPAAQQMSSSPGTPALVPASSDVEAQTKSTPRVPAAKNEEPQPKHENTVVLPARGSRISLSGLANGARAGAPALAQPAYDLPVIALGSAPASGSLSNLARPVSASTPSVLTQSKLEPVMVVRKVPPVYPTVARQNRLSGSVVVQGTVDKNGKIRDLELISGPPLFRDAAFQAVKQWVFKPARLNGQAIDQSTRIRVDFGEP